MVEQHLSTYDSTDMSSKTASPVTLSLPEDAPGTDHDDFRRLCGVFTQVRVDPGVVLDHAYWIEKSGLVDLYDRPLLAAAAHVVIDLVDQGWAAQATGDQVKIVPPGEHAAPEDEKARVRKQEHLRRDAQLRQSSVRRFVQKMEQPRQHGGQLVSVFNLMRDGQELATALESLSGGCETIQPYVQVVDTSAVCERTGLRLHDIWRYFRHTWSNAYATVPGRSMPILVRDAATEHHAVIGLAALSSPVVQIAERDRWIGWDTNGFLESLKAEPTRDVVTWLKCRLRTQLDEIFVDDFLDEGILEWPELQAPTADTIARLKEDSERHRMRHHQGGRVRQIRSIESDSWVQRAKTDLFRSKRAALLAETLDIQMGISAYLHREDPEEGLKEALAHRKTRAQIGRLVRRARGERVGTVVADLTVCGAVAPYNALVAGKLVGALAVSPTSLAAYKAKYGRASEIASVTAGRPIVREPRLSLITTTSLYGSGSSQYNRLFWPASAMGGAGDEKLGFNELGRSRSFGTSQFSQETVESLVRAAELVHGRVRVNNLFGEGVSPRLRKVRLGLAALGWPANEMLKHRRERILYGVPLVRNLRDYSLGIETEPDYLVDADNPEVESWTAEWWLTRWGQKRAQQPQVQAALRQHRLTRPVQHGARVALPVLED